MHHKSHTQKLPVEAPAHSGLSIISDGHFEISSRGCREEPLPSTSRMRTNTGGNGWQQPIQAPAESANNTKIHWMGNVAHSRLFNFPLEFFNLIRQMMRDEAECFYHLEGTRLETSLSSCPSSPSPPKLETLKGTPLVGETSNWLNKAAQKVSASRKRGRDSIQQGTDPSSESDLDNRRGRIHL